MKNIKDHYLKKSDEYGWGLKSAQLDPERIIELNRFVIGETVLDIGCATGVYIDYLAQKGFKATGVDFVPDFIEYAKTHREGEFLKADAAMLPFKDSSFDTVILFDILEHLDDEKVLKEATRVAKKRIIAAFPQKTNGSIDSFGLVYRHHLDTSHLRVYTKEDIEKLFSKLKLNIITIKGITYVDSIGLLKKLINFHSVFLTKALVKILRIIARIQNFPTELLIVAEKKDDQNSH